MSATAQPAHTMTGAARWLRARWHDAAAAGMRFILIGIAIFVAVALLGPVIWGQNPLAVNLLDVLKAPSAAHPFGTDEYGRDVLARFLYGARLSLVLGVGAVAGGALIGLVVGAFIGLVGGTVDNVVSRALDGILAFPALILGMAFALAIGPGGLSAALAVGIAGIPWYARVVRSEVLSLRSREFIDAERALGAPRRRILRRHVIPSVLGGLTVQASLGVAYAVLAIAGLGFLGLGVRPPTPEFGAMITEGRDYMSTGQWWISIFPGIGLLILVGLSMALGEALRDQLDPYGKLSY
jgi:peptide/nickel transport system permease protein